MTAKKFAVKKDSLQRKLNCRYTVECQNVKMSRTFTGRVRIGGAGGVK